MAIDFPAPMQAPERLVQPFSSPDWLYEIKHDGFRCLAGIEPGEPGDVARVQLRTKTGTDCTAWFPEIARGLAVIPGGPHIIDGEAAVLGADGVSDFNRMMERARRRRWYSGAPPVALCAFDLLLHTGEPVLQLPLVERKARLEALLAPCARVAVMFVGELPADELLFHAMVAAGLKVEGVMAKLRTSPYRPGVRSDDWRKIKRPDWMEGRRWRN
jgi:bifunctional non-homologous end joining protein LigD